MSSVKCQRSKFTYANIVFVIKFGSSLKFHSLQKEMLMNNAGEEKEYSEQKMMNDIFLQFLKQKAF